MTRICPKCSSRYPDTRRYCGRCLVRVESEDHEIEPLLNTPDAPMAAIQMPIAWLRLMRSGRPTMERTPLPWTSQRIGRASMSLPDGPVVGLLGLTAFERLHISRIQAIIEQDENGGWSLASTGRSAHLVQVNGEVVEERVSLDTSARVVFGAVVFVFEIESAAPEAASELPDPTLTTMELDSVPMSPEAAPQAEDEHVEEAGGT